MATKIQIRRGNAVNLPALSEGEPGFTLDTKELYIGSSTGNVKINPDAKGVPAGGTTGQILAKKSNVDYDTQWVDPPDVTIDSITADKVITDPNHRFVTDSQITQWNANNGGTVSVGNSINVQNYYISGQSDWTQSIKNAAAEAVARSVPLFFPAGTYKVSSTCIDVTSPLCIQGEGENVTIINYTGTGITTPVIRYNNTAFFYIKDLKITGSGRTGIGIQFGSSAYVNRITMQNVHFAGLNIGFQHASGWINDAFSIKAYNCGTGIYSRCINLNMFGGVVEDCDTGMNVGEITNIYGTVCEGCHNFSLIFPQLGNWGSGILTMYSAYFEGTPDIPQPISIGSISNVPTVIIEGGTFYKSAINLDRVGKAIINSPGAAVNTTANTGIVSIQNVTTYVRGESGATYRLSVNANGQVIAIQG